MGSLIDTKSKIITGTSKADTLTGTVEADTLDGKSGAGTMRGGKGDDLCIVDSGKDKVVEKAGEGILVKALVSRHVAIHKARHLRQGTLSAVRRRQPLRSIRASRRGGDRTGRFPGVHDHGLAKPGPLRCRSEDGWAWLGP